MSPKWSRVIGRSKSSRLRRAMSFPATIRRFLNDIRRRNPDLKAGSFGSTRSRKMREAGTLQRRRFLGLVASAAAFPFAAQAAYAETYPSRPVHLIVGFGPGGSPEIIARLIGQALSERLGQQFVIENRPGAGTTIATESVVRASPDGYTLPLVTMPNITRSLLY